MTSENEELASQSFSSNLFTTGQHSAPQLPLVDSRIENVYEGVSNLPSQIELLNPQPTQLMANETATEAGNAYSDDFMWDFAETQPMLQWLDSDLSALGETWGMDWNTFGQ